MEYKAIKQRYESMGYRFLPTMYALNIFGIRSKESKSNSFDDIVGVAWKNTDGKENVMTFPATTDPGKYWLQNPMKKDGTIIMVPGQYKEVYQAGKHAGKYDAFVQCGRMAYVRDNNLDTSLDFDLYRDPAKRSINVFWDICGTNLHRANEGLLSQFVSKYSAGCQVIQDSKNFKTLLDIRDWSTAMTRMRRFDYTLFED